MKSKILFTSCLLSLLLNSPGNTAVTLESNSSNLLWKLQTEWKLHSKPLDIVHTLDGKKVFILTDKHTVQVYNSTGKLEGTIPVAEGVTAIDIEPRGENLYLIDNKNNLFSSLAIDFIRDINIVGSPFKGNVDAPVTIAIFTDFE